MTKRSNGEGSYYYDEKKEIWVWRISLNGKRYCLYAKKRKDLKPKIEQLMEKLDRPVSACGDAKTLAEWLDEWLAAIKPTVKIRTYEFYDHACRLYIKPNLGNIQLEKITPLILQKFINDMANKPGVSGKMLSPATINGFRRTLKVSLTYAYNNNFIANNPIKATKPIKRIKNLEIHALTAEQIQHLLDIASKQDYIYTNVKQRFVEDDGMRYFRQCTYYSLLLALSTGMRQGEIFALTWENVDLDAGVIIVSKNVQYSHSQGTVWGTPKSGKNRRISIDEGSVAALRKWKVIQNNYALSYQGLFQNDEDLLFTNSLGKVINVTNYKRSYWSKLKIAAGLPESFRWHDLRHTHATMLLQAGVPIKVVSERLGHSSVQQTVDTYYNLLPDIQSEAVKAIESLALFKKP